MGDEPESNELAFSVNLVAGKAEDTMNHSIISFLTFLLKRRFDFDLAIFS